MRHWENPKSVKPLKTIIIITTESITDGEIMNESGSRVGMDIDILLGNVLLHAVNLKHFDLRREDPWKLRRDSTGWAKRRREKQKEQGEINFNKQKSAKGMRLHIPKP